jgi:hypothetical protein
MNKPTPKNLFLCVLFSLCATTAIAEDACKPTEEQKAVSDFAWVFTGAFRPEMFYSRNINFNNNKIDHDKIWYMRHNLDANVDLKYGMLTYDAMVAELYVSMRNKGIWGNPNSLVPTTRAFTKILKSVTGLHAHAVPRMMFWMREVWMRLDASKIMGLGLPNEHTFTLGAFPFELGRGISLGDAYAVSQEILGFYTDNSIDQYAFGGKLSGDIIPDKLGYDVYVGLLQNRTSGFGDTSEESKVSLYNGLSNGVRGFGVVNFVAAGRFNIDIFNNKRFGSLHLEPYGLYNSDPEQRIIFPGDANGKLGTLGLACEYKGGRFELGFDYAQNLGRQMVRGVDRNVVQLENRLGVVNEVNSQVLQGSPTSRRKALVTPDAEALIKASRADEILGVNKQAQNGESIGFCADQNTELFNSAIRFRDPYLNTYQGWMFVTDAALWVYKKDLQVAVTAGVASGDENPNTEVIDGTYTGFIPLQSNYAGKRVKSIFVIGQGSPKRPLSAPRSNQAPNQFADVLNGFTNIVLCGASLNYKPKDVEKAYKIMPNFLVYWQQKPTKRFDIPTMKETNQDARSFLGSELNLYLDYYLLKDLRLYLVGGAFFPGDHYQDIRGIPLDDAQKRALDRIDFTGFELADVPNIGTDVSYSFNLGMEFKW